MLGRATIRLGIGPHSSWIMVSENGGAQWSDVNSDGVSPGSRRNVRVIHLRPTMKKYSSIDNILAYSDL